MYVNGFLSLHAHVDSTDVFIYFSSELEYRCAGLVILFAEQIIVL